MFVKQNLEVSGKISSDDLQILQGEMHLLPIIVALKVTEIFVDDILG